MIKICVICGNDFKASPSDKKVTCGESLCVSQRRKQMLQARHVHWSDEARKRASDRGETPNLKLGTPAAQRSPIAGPFETNQEAKWWWVISPENVHYKVRNLRKFCRDHPDLFQPASWQHAYAGLKTVNRSLNGKTPRSVGQWKGWRLAQPSEEVIDQS